ncbi:MAG: biopolymer transporter ExbD [Betaproteobacteria bacterium]|jgi:biopolymer transport protein ExbD
MRYFETRKARIEIIPMIDIMLFLLVFFAMMTLRMIPTSGHISKLPTSSTSVKMPPPKLLIEIKEDGVFYAEGSDRNAEQITNLVKSRNPSELAVTLAGSDKVNLQQLMSAIDAVKRGGAIQIGLAAKQAP